MEPRAKWNDVFCKNAAPKATHLSDHDIYDLLEKTQVKCTCGKRCLSGYGGPMNYPTLCKVIKHCRSEVHNMRNDEKEAFIRNLVSGCVKHNGNNYATLSRLQVDYHIGCKFTPNMPYIHVCKTAFRIAYDCSFDIMRKVSKNIREGFHHSARPFNAKSTVSVETQHFMRDEMKSNGVNIDRTTWNFMTMPNGRKSHAAIEWIERYFYEMGDQCPNRDEIHLEPITMLEIYKDYEQTMVNILKDSDYLKYTSFTTLWNKHFPHVHIREYKVVTGKCQCCENLSFARRSYTDTFRRMLITKFHAYHRAMYMGERHIYYQQRSLAATCPDRYMSIILDGMAQTHTILPWCGNQRSFPKPLAQHLQGVLVHGSEMLLYRTFHNLCNDSDLTIHTLLSVLERRIQAAGKLPDTLFIRVDGGAENSNKYVKAICELLIARRLTKEIFVSRLPVGHTHEDIDGKFGQLWRGFRSQYVYTPQVYKAKCEELLRSSLPTKVMDLFAIPDYKTLLDPHLRDWQRYAREEDTILVFRFNAVKVSSAFPMGVQVHYRKYAQDKPPIIVDSTDPGNPIKYQVDWRNIQWEPQPCKENNYIGGIYMLQEPLRGVIRPAPFIEGSHKALKDTIGQIKKDFGTQQPAILTAWEDFERSAPTSDDSNAYVVNAGGLHVPLYSKLFTGLKSPQRLSPDFDGLEEINLTAIAPEYRDASSAIYHKQSDALPSLQWGNRKGDIRCDYPATVPLQYPGQSREDALRSYYRTVGQDYSKMTRARMTEICKARSISITSSWKNEDFVQALKRWDTQQCPGGPNPIPSNPHATDTCSVEEAMEISLRHSFMHTRDLKRELDNLNLPYSSNATKLEMARILSTHRIKRIRTGAPIATTTTATTVGAPIATTTTATTVGAPIATTTTATTVGAPIATTTTATTVGAPIATTTTATTVGAPIADRAAKRRRLNPTK